MVRKGGHSGNSGGGHTGHDGKFRANGTKTVIQKETQIFQEERTKVVVQKKPTPAKKSFADLP